MVAGQSSSREKKGFNTEEITSDNSFPPCNGFTEILHPGFKTTRGSLEVKAYVVGGTIVVEARGLQASNWAGSYQNDKEK